MFRYLLPVAMTIAIPAAAQAPAYPAAKDIPVALLVDLGSGQTLFRRNEAQPFLPASVTKAMTALVAFELIQQGKLREDQRFAVRPETFRKWRGQGTTMPLDAADTPTVRQLLTGITTVSANDASVVLAEGAAGSVEGWSALMNATAKRLGMTGSQFATPNGWPDEGRTFVTARDLAILANELVSQHPQLYRRYIGNPEMSWHGITQKNHDPTLRVVPGADGIKTGHTFEAGFNFLGSAQRGGRRLAVVVAGARIHEARAKAARELLEWGFSAWNSRILVPTGQPVGTAKVQGGEDSLVTLVAAQPVSVTAQRGTAPSVVTRIVYAGPLRAPITKGTQVASLELTVDGQAALPVPLFAANAIAAAGPIDRLFNGLAGLFG